MCVQLYLGDCVVGLFLQGGICLGVPQGDFVVHPYLQHLITPA